MGRLAEEDVNINRANKLTFVDRPRKSYKLPYKLPRILKQPLTTLQNCVGNFCNLFFLQNMTGCSCVLQFNDSWQV